DLLEIGADRVGRGGHLGVLAGLLERFGVLLVPLEVVLVGLVGVLVLLGRLLRGLLGGLLASGLLGGRGGGLLGRERLGRLLVLGLGGGLLGGLLRRLLGGLLGGLLRGLLRRCGLVVVGRGGLRRRGLLGGLLGRLLRGLGGGGARGGGGAGGGDSLAAGGGPVDDNGDVGLGQRSEHQLALGGGGLRRLQDLSDFRGRQLSIA